MGELTSEVTNFFFYPQSVEGFAGSVLDAWVADVKKTDGTIAHVRDVGRWPSEEAARESADKQLALILAEDLNVVPPWETVEG